MIERNAKGQFIKGMIPLNKKEHIRKVCKCGKVFYVKPSLDRIKNCSRSCGATDRPTSSKQKEAARVQGQKNKGRKGQTPWNKGKEFPQVKKENNPNWKGGITSFEHAERVRFRNEIQKQVFERDDYTCQICGDKKDLQVDHIQSWAEYIELRFNIDNCRTLCMKCHYEITFNKPMPKDIKAWGHNLKRRGLI